MNLENIEIRKTNWGSVAKFKSFAEKEHVQMKEDDTVYFGAYIGDKLIGFAGYKIVGKKVRYKADYIFNRFRRKGVYSKIWEERDKEVFELLKRKGFREINAFCTSKSVGMYLKNNFKQVSKNENNITFVRKVI